MIVGAYHTATQPSSRYSGTPTQRGAVGQQTFSTMPATAPPHTIHSTVTPVLCGMARRANGV